MVAGKFIHEVWNRPKHLNTAAGHQVMLWDHHIWRPGGLGGGGEGVDHFWPVHADRSKEEGVVVNYTLSKDAFRRRRSMALDRPRVCGNQRVIKNLGEVEATEVLLCCVGGYLHIQVWCSQKW